MTTKHRNIDKKPEKMKENIVLIGKGGFGQEIAQWLVDSDYHVSSTTSTEYEPKGNDVLLLCIGDPAARKAVAEKLDTMGVQYDSVAGYGNERFLNEGCIICRGVQMTTNITLGKHVIINLNCTIGHDAVIGDFVTLSPGVHVSGNVELGNGVYVGSGAVFKEGVKVCPWAVIGAGAVVLENITEPGTYVGVPAKKVK